MATKDSLGDRQKRHELSGQQHLPLRIPAIVRIDGRAFSSITKKMFGKGYNHDFSLIMAQVAKTVMEQMQGCDFAYGQSDEISFLLTDYRTIRTSAWFDNNISKLVSVSASAAASEFTRQTGEFVTFDSRAFSVPQDDVCNYFLWRQQDSTRNAIQMAGREYFSHKELHRKSTSDIQEMLLSKHGINFNDYPIMRKRGYCIVEGYLNDAIPIFSQDRQFIEKHVYIRED